MPTLRRPTRQVCIGDNRVGFVKIGGGLPDRDGSPTTAAPVSVQTMTAGYTHEIDRCVAEINKLAAAGADIVRVAVPEKKDTEALKEILPRVRVPIVADVHFHFQRALEAIEAGVHKIRLNPGNITDRKQVIDVIQACKGAQGGRGIPIRIGVNEGSIIERKDKEKRMKELGAFFAGHKHGHLLAIMIAKLEEYLDIFYEQDFRDIVISAKSMDAAFVVDAYTEISKRFESSPITTTGHPWRPATSRKSRAIAPSSPSSASPRAPMSTANPPTAPNDSAIPPRMRSAKARKARRTSLTIPVQS